MERKDWGVIDQAAAVLSDQSNQSRMIDLEGTRAMICLDNLPAAQVTSLMAAHANGESDVIALNSNGNMSLPSAEDRATADLF